MEYNNSRCLFKLLYKMDYLKIFTLSCSDEICSVVVIEKVESSWNVEPFKHD